MYCPSNKSSTKETEWHPALQMCVFPVWFLLRSANTMVNMLGSILHFVYLMMQLAILVLIVYIYWNRNQGIWTFSFEYFNTPFGDIRTGAQYNPVSGSSVCSMRNSNYLTSGGGITDYVSKLFSISSTAANKE